MGMLASLGCVCGGCAGSVVCAGKKGVFALLLAMFLMRSKPVVFQWYNQSDGVDFSATHVICYQYTVGFVCMLPFYYQDLQISTIRESISTTTFLKFMLAECLNRVCGFLMTVAEETINVQLLNNLNQLQAVWILVLAYLFFDGKVDVWNFCNHATILAGVAVMLMLSGAAPKQLLGMDVAIVLICGLAYPLSTLIDLSAVKSAPFGFVVLFKLLVGVGAYHSILINEEGFEGLGVAYGPKMWKSLWWYGLLYGPVVSCLYVYSLKKCSATTLSIGTVSGYIFSIFWGIVLLSEYPTHDQAIGSVFIGFALLSGVIRIFSNNTEEDAYPAGRERSMSQGEEVAYPLDCTCDTPCDEEHDGESAELLYPLTPRAGRTRRNYSSFVTNLPIQVSIPRKSHILKLPTPPYRPTIPRNPSMDQLSV